MLDNFDHIKAYWIMLTPSIAQIALRFGANDLDGTVVEEKIYHDAGRKDIRVHTPQRTRAADSAPPSRPRRTRHALQSGDRSKLPPIVPATPPGLVSLTLNA